MVSIDKAAIVLTMAIVAIALGVAASGDMTQDAGPAVFTPSTVSTETSEPETSSFGADLAAEIREKAEQTIEVEDKVDMEDTSMEETMMEETMMEETMMEETMMEETSEPETIHVEIPTGTSYPGCEETNSCYSPADVTINAGDTVHWMNVDSSAHTVTAGTSADVQIEVFDSSLIMADGTWSHEFNDAGIYDYFCMIHPWMTGTVTVN